MKVGGGTTAVLRGGRGRSQAQCGKGRCTAPRTGSSRLGSVLTRWPGSSGEGGGGVGPWDCAGQGPLHGRSRATRVDSATSAVGTSTSVATSTSADFDAIVTTTSATSCAEASCGSTRTSCDGNRSASYVSNCGTTSTSNTPSFTCSSSSNNNTDSTSICYNCTNAGCTNTRLTSASTSTASSTSSTLDHPSS